MNCEEVKKTFHTKLNQVCEDLDLRPAYVIPLSEYMDMEFDIYIAGFVVKGKIFLLQARMDGTQVTYHILITRDFKNKHGVRKITYHSVRSNKNLESLLSTFKRDYNVYYKLEK